MELDQNVFSEFAAALIKAVPTVRRLPLLLIKVTQLPQSLDQEISENMRADAMHVLY